ncbi:DNA polymerase Y family protein [Kitasatospora sp. NPDC049285]|uniref:DNA polymerase Y family protein n=1 Tax=Kitasatospora sp. NPDC049285 TaxID=3157096 RepID=UPI00341B6DE8
MKHSSPIPKPPKPWSRDGAGPLWGTSRDGEAAGPGATAQRVLVVWCPDWPLVATAPAGGDVTAVAVVADGRVLASSDAARAAGVRRGMPLRLAQRYCPELRLRDRDEEAEARRFEPVVAAVEAFTPRVEVLRPGLCAIPVKGPARYFGGEESLAGQIQDAVAAVLALTWPVTAPAPAEQPADELTGEDAEPAWVGEVFTDPEGDRTPPLTVVDGTSRPDPGTPAAPLPAEPPAAPPGINVPYPEASSPPAAPPRGLVGIADGLFAAVLAARVESVVPAGRTPEFLAPYPVSALGDLELAELLHRLGIDTVGAFAALSADAVANRFGPGGTAAHRQSRGLDPRPLAPKDQGLDLGVEQVFDPPEELAEPLVFVGRTLAEQLHARLAGVGLACQRVSVEVACVSGRSAARLWQHEGRLSAAALAERVRWQLGAWQSAGTFTDADGGFTVLRLVPDGLFPDRGRQLALWGEAVAEDRVERAVARVQSLLGYAGLRRGEPAGGRGPDEQQVRLPWDESATGAGGTTAPDASWPGRLQDPAPSVVPPAPVQVTVLDRDGQPVTVDGRAEVSAAPHLVELHGRTLTVIGWTGPWPAVERWWDQRTARRRARIQVAVDGGRALLLTVEGGRWYVEGAYD